MFRFVINYDFPRHMEEYVHRIGRTGRAGRTGTAVTLMTRGDWRSAQPLIDILVEANQVRAPNSVIVATYMTLQRQEVSFSECSSRVGSDGKAFRVATSARGCRGRQGRSRSSRKVSLISTLI